MPAKKPVPASKPRKLTLKQRRFVEKLALASSGTDAAMQTYDIHGKNVYNIAAEIASQNLKKPAVAAAIAEINDASKYATIMSLVKRKERLSKLAESEPEHPDPIRAIDLLNKMEQIYGEREEKGSPTHIEITYHVINVVERPPRKVIEATEESHAQ